MRCSIGVPLSPLSPAESADRRSRLASLFGWFQDAVRTISLKQVFIPVYIDLTAGAGYGGRSPYEAREGEYNIRPDHILWPGFVFYSRIRRPPEQCLTAL